MTDSPFNNVLPEITGSTWWQPVTDRFHEFLERVGDGPVLILYNADADGFCASYFVNLLLRRLSASASQRIIHRKAVWNYEFDFRWAPQLVRSRASPPVICLDLPIRQEPEVLLTLAESTHVWIYDHHVLPKDARRDLANIEYVNSRVLDPDGISHPTAGLAAALAEQNGVIRRTDYVVAAIGLLGDRSLQAYPRLQSVLAQLVPDLVAGGLTWNSPLGHLTSMVNAMFAARPGTTPERAEERLADLFGSTTPGDALRVFSQEFDLESAQRLVSSEIDTAIANLDADPNRNRDLFCQVIPMSTFSVGVVATVLCERSYSRVVSLGFEASGNVQFELRTKDDSGIDLTKVLSVQREEFIPITSGGHPKAAGALVRASDAHLFTQTLRRAVLKRIAIGE